MNHSALLRLIIILRYIWRSAILLWAQTDKTASERNLLDIYQVFKYKIDRTRENYIYSSLRFRDKYWIFRRKKLLSDEVSFQLENGLSFPCNLMHQCSR